MGRRMKAARGSASQADMPRAGDMGTTPRSGPRRARGQGEYPCREIAVTLSEGGGAAPSSGTGSASAGFGVPARPGWDGCACGVSGAGAGPRRSRATKRSMQSARLRPCDRKRDERIARMPSLESREPRARRILLLCTSSRDGLLRTSKRSSARVLTRLTFCPPGPGLAVKTNRSSPSGIARPGCMRMSFTECRPGN